MVIGDPRLKLKTGITVKTDNPSEVGADRLVNAFAAWRRFKASMIVIDFGTATTFDVVSAQGDYLGGVIAPGVNLSLDALHRAAAKLPNVAIQPPDKVIGTNTIGAMQSGIYYGYAGMVESVTAKIKKEFGAPMKVIATGGLASLYAKACPAIEQVDPDLTITGLKELYQLNH
jgi:type III pantothenate kinase